MTSPGAPNSPKVRAVEAAHAKGLKAAYGRRRGWSRVAAGHITRGMRRYDQLRRSGPRPDYIEFIPATSDPGVLADLAGRINWYLHDRSVPVFMEGAAGASVDASDAPHLDPSVVYNPGWEVSRPRGRAEVVIHNVGPRTGMRFLRQNPATIASAEFSAEAERGWFDLQSRYGSTASWSAADSAGLLNSLRNANHEAFLLATGPSAQEVDLSAVGADLRITCNSAVRNSALLRDFAPTIVAFADPVFHCGPSRYASAFRADLRRALTETSTLALTTSQWIGPVLAHWPELRERLIVLQPDSGAPWRWPTSADMSVRSTANVLTLLMLPVAFGTSERIQIAGCDGRKSSERYFWKHNPETQYADTLMQSAFTTHPAFFRDRDYADYYAQHCDEVEQFLSFAERGGKSVEAATPSHIPALRRRGATSIG